MKRWDFPWIAIVLVASSAIIACAPASTADDSEGMVAITLFRWDLNIGTGDEIGRLIADEFGIRFETESPSWDGWHERLMTRMAAGSAPDVFVGYGPMDGPTYRQWITEEMILPLNEYLTDSPNLRSYLSRYDRQQVGGHWYSIPVEDVSDHVLIMRADWLDELGLGVPDTLDDLRLVAEAMRDRYGVFPITSSAPHTAGFFWLNGFFYALGSRWSDWLWSDDEGWIPSWIAEQSLAAVAYLRDLYRDGLLDPDFMINTDLRKRELFAIGEAGIVFDNQVDLYAESLVRSDASAQLVIAPPPDGPGGRGMWGLDGYFSSIMLSAGIQAEKRDAFLKFLEFMHGEPGETLFRVGIEDRHFVNTPTGPHPLGELAATNASGTAVSLTDIAPHTRLRYLRALEWFWTPPWHEYREQLADAVEIGRQYGIPPRFENVVTDAAERYEAQLRDLVYASYAEMVTSAAPMEAMWDDFVTRYRSSGGDQLILELNAHPDVVSSPGK